MLTETLDIANFCKTIETMAQLTPISHKVLLSVGGDAAGTFEKAYPMTTASGETATRCSEVLRHVVAMLTNRVCDVPRDDACLAMRDLMMPLRSCKHADKEPVEKTMCFCRTNTFLFTEGLNSMIMDSLSEVLDVCRWYVGSPKHGLGVFC